MWSKKISISQLLAGWVGVLGLAWLAPPLGAEIITVDIDGVDGPTLSAPEQDRLDGLLAVRSPQILSDLSPDGRTLVVALVNSLDPGDRTLHFLDITTGELSDSLALDYEVFAPELPLRWIDNQSVWFVQEDIFSPWEIITVNRHTDIVSRTRIYPAQEEAGEMLGIAPDRSKFVLRLYEGEEDGIYMVFLPSLQRVEISRLPAGLDIQPPVWSASGDQVVLVTASIEERRLYDRTPDSPSLANPVVQDALGRLAPEENLFRQHHGVRVFDFSQAELLQFELKAQDEPGVMFAGASFSPDGSRVLLKLYEAAQVAGRDHPTYLFPQAASYRVYDSQGQPLETLTFDQLRGPLESAGRFLTRDRLLFWGSYGLDRSMYTYDLGRGQLQPLPLPSGSVDWPSVATSDDGHQIVYGFSSVTQPPELFTLNLAGDRTPQALTTVNATVADLNQVRLDPVSFTTRDGERQGLLIQPAGHSFPPQNSPVVFWQQGGPGFSIANEFAIAVEMPLNLLPNFGIPVVAVALTGREGFGPDLYRRQADHQNFGQIDIEEGADIINQMIQSGWTTTDQVGISGCSYGGYFAAQMTVRFPRLLAAANPQCTLLDTLTEWQLGYSSLMSYLVGQTPMENPDHYVQLSPLYNATAIRIPTLMFHGQADFLQIDVVRNFHDVIAAAGVPVTLYEFAATGHSLQDPAYQRIAAQLQIDFFRRYLD